MKGASTVVVSNPSGMLQRFFCISGIAIVDGLELVGVDSLEEAACIAIEEKPREGDEGTHLSCLIIYLPLWC